MAFCSMLNKACAAIEKSPALRLAPRSAPPICDLILPADHIFLHNAYSIPLILIAMALTGIQITYNLLDHGERNGQLIRLMTSFIRPS
jgi:hypothetical protein